jgi:hypothetical protein
VSARVRSLRRTQCGRRWGRPRLRQTPLQGVRIRAVGAVDEMTGRGLVLCWLLGQIVPLCRIPSPLEGARPARHRVGAGHSLIFLEGASPRLRAQACTLLADGRLWTPRRAHLHRPVWRQRGRPGHVVPVDRDARLVSAPRRWQRRIFIGRDITLPRLVALDTVVILIELGDLFLLVLLLAHGRPPFCGRLVALEDRLLRERRLRMHKVEALQLEKQGAEESMVVKYLREDQHSIQDTKLVGKFVGRRNHEQNFQSPHWGALEESSMAATQRSTSRSPTPHDAGSRSATGTQAQLQSLPRGACRLSSRRGASAASRAGRLPGRGTS